MVRHTDAPYSHSFAEDEVVYTCPAMVSISGASGVGCSMKGVSFTITEDIIDK
jgi:hypothetical protein